MLTKNPIIKYQPSYYPEYKPEHYKSIAPLADAPKWMMWVTRSIMRTNITSTNSSDIGVISSDILCKPRFPIGL